MPVFTVGHPLAVLRFHLACKERSPVFLFLRFIFFFFFFFFFFLLLLLVLLTGP